MHRLPAIGERVRSYVLDTEGTCTKQEGQISRYTGNTLTPYEVTSVDNTQAKACLTLRDLEGRIEGDDGCTLEETQVKEELVIKLFQPDIPSEHQRLAQERLYQETGKIPNLPQAGLLPYKGGIYTVYRDETDQKTKAGIIYQDEDSEVLAFEDMLEQVAFENYTDKPLRLQTLAKRQKPTTRHHSAADADQQKWVLRKQKQKIVNRRKRKTVSHTSSQTLLQQSVKRSAKRNKSWLAPGEKHRGWERPGIVFLESPLAQSQMRGGRGGSGSPGLPHGIAGDYG